MERSNFLKTLGISGLGVATGILTPFSVFADNNQGNLRINMIDDTIIDMTQQGDEKFIWGWLLRTVGSALIGSLVSKIVDNYTGTCYCNGTSCTANTASSDAYSDTKGYYGYSGYQQKFLTQQLNDPYASFGNASVPFVKSNGNVISSVEGPFLAGLCFAAEDINKTYGQSAARQIIQPIYELSNGGYRFNAVPCYPTVFKTGYGKTTIKYAPDDDGTGYVKTGVVEVNVQNSVDRLDFSKSWRVNAA
jgi:hypothetical protein